MSVTVEKRGISRCDVVTKAYELCCYTLKICSNQNVFDQKYYRSLIRDLEELSKNIFIHSWLANDIKVESITDWQTLEKMIKEIKYDNQTN